MTVGGISQSKNIICQSKWASKKKKKKKLNLKKIKIKLTNKINKINK